jgi:hypothetical protein
MTGCLGSSHWGFDLRRECAVAARSRIAMNGVSLMA